MSQKKNNKQTSKEVAKVASEILNSGDKFSKKAKIVAASALSQTKKNK